MLIPMHSPKYCLACYQTLGKADHSPALKMAMLQEPEGALDDDAPQAVNVCSGWTAWHSASNSHSELWQIGMGGTGAFRHKTALSILNRTDCSQSSGSS